jgi:DNA polymerase III alpha subunit
MSEKRFQTFKTKLSPYKEIYEKNKSYEQFANWYFETKLLGYSYSTTLQKVFSTDKNRFYNTYEHSTFQKGERVKMVCVVEDVLSGVSRNGNKYIKLSLHDEIGSVQAMIGDFRTPNLTKYKDSGGVTPKKDNIIVIVGEKSDDIIFVDRMSIMDDKIYMKLSDLK